MNKKMKLVIALLLSALFAAGAIAIGCDDDGGGGGSNVCEKAAQLGIDALKKVCDEYPDCSLCQEPDTTDTGEAAKCEGATKDAAQAAVDAWDEATYIEPLKAVCEAEASAGGTDADTSTGTGD